MKFVVVRMIDEDLMGGVDGPWIAEGPDVVEAERMVVGEHFIEFRNTIDELVAIFKARDVWYAGMEDKIEVERKAEEEEDADAG